MYDVIIIGAGVSGCAIARELSRRKGSFLIIDKEEDVCCGTSKANSAIVHAGYDAPQGSLMAKLNVRGSRMMPRLAQELDFPYQNIGSLVVMTRGQDRQDLVRLYENGIANGVSGLRIIKQEELRQMEPHISPDAVAALYAPTGAIVCPFALTYALAENAAKNGVRFQFDTEVMDITPISGGWKLETTQGVLETKVVVNAAGVYADRLHNMVSHDPMTIVPRRGDYFLLDRSTEGFVRHTVFQLPTKYGKGVLVSPTVHGNTIVGPTAIDIEDKDCVSTTQEGLEQVRSKSGLAIQGLPLRQTITSFAGLRAHDVRHRFTIEGTAPGFVDCAGIESPGLSCSPAIGEMVAGMVADILHLEENPDFDGSRKGIVNPAALPMEQRRALIASQPAYGNIICRCETVSEGEILDAIRRTPGARSVDGVKRRTRAGMGRCQGGFCSPKVMEILARELDIPLSQVTKSGKGSEWILGSNKDRL